MLIAFAKGDTPVAKAIPEVKMRNIPILASDGRALIVVMDHARTHGAIEGLEDPGAVIEASVDGGADAFMTTFGVAKRYREQLAGRIPTIIRLDGGPSPCRARASASPALERRTPWPRQRASASSTARTSSSPITQRTSAR